MKILLPINIFDLIKVSFLHSLQRDVKGMLASSMNTADSILSFYHSYKFIFFSTVTNTLPFNYLYIYQAIVNCIFPQPWPHCSTGKKDVPMIFQKINERITVCPKKLYNSAIVNICHSSQKNPNFLKIACQTHFFGIGIFRIICSPDCFSKMT